MKVWKDRNLQQRLEYLKIKFIYKNISQNINNGSLGYVYNIWEKKKVFLLAFKSFQRW